jgi:hypothetical protein
VDYHTRQIAGLQLQQAALLARQQQLMAGGGLDPQPPAPAAGGEREELLGRVQGLQRQVSELLRHLQAQLLPPPGPIPHAGQAEPSRVRGADVECKFS